MNSGRVPLEPGSRLYRYELLCPIAHGGMASVWLARFVGKHGFEKLVAVKTILPEYASDPRFQQMFLDEARIASGIEHVNVAQILDLGEQHEVLYIVMEWVDGDSLSKLSRAVEHRGERVPLGVTLRLMADTCGGLHAAHELADKTGKQLGVVHRDVSPQNVLVSSKGNAKLIDFGIVKALDRLSGDTNAGLLKGKIQYMAPEQARGGALDRRADVWAAGAVLYYLLSGAPPFEGENQLATLHMLTSGQPPPPLPSNIPAPVHELVARALAFDAKDRTASAADLQRQLEHAMLMCGVFTTPSDVAAFVAKELGDRAEARKRAIEQALAAATEREGIHAPMGSPGITSEMHRPSSASASQMTSNPGISGSGISKPGIISGNGISASGKSAPGASGPHGSFAAMAGQNPGGADATMLAPAPGTHPAPRREGMLGGIENPISQVSNATLGSAAVAYPQHSVPPPGSAKRSALPAILGILFAVGIVGSGAFFYQRGALRSATAQPVSIPVATQTAAAPSNAITSEPAGTAAATATTATGLASAAAAPSAAPSTSATAAVNAVASSAPTAAKSSNHSSSQGHGAKPSPHPASTDYGF